MRRASQFGSPSELQHLQPSDIFGETYRIREMVQALNGLQITNSSSTSSSSQTSSPHRHSCLRWVKKNFYCFSRLLLISQMWKERRKWVKIKIEKRSFYHEGVYVCMFMFHQHHYLLNHFIIIVSLALLQFVSIFTQDNEHSQTTFFTSSHFFSSNKNEVKMILLVFFLREGRSLREELRQFAT